MGEYISSVLYFPDKLKSRLEGLKYYPMTIVEAPSGFGKTTAVQEYLNRNCPDAVQLWYTCLGETAEKAWNGICALFRRVDPNIADAMRDMEFPTDDTLGDLAMLLREARCESETYLMIDNYQLIDSDIPRQLMNAFSVHGNPKLHIVFITQQLNGSHQGAVHHANIHYIDTDNLLFDRESTNKYFRTEGIRLSESELNDVCENTEGWVAAIRLQMQGYRETSAFQRTRDIEQLIRTAIWNRLSEEEREFLLSISVLDGFTTGQAQIMLDAKNIPGNILRLLDGNAFIRYLPEKSLYIIHAILQDYLRNRFYNHQTEAFQTLMLHRAGTACASVREYYAAARFYRRVGDFEAILSLPFDHTYLYNQKEKNIITFIEELTIDCPDDIMRRHTSTVLAFAFHLQMSRRMEAFSKLVGVVASITSSPSVVPGSELYKLKGELALLLSFRHYNDIRKMSQGHREAMSYLGGPSTFFLPTTPWTFMNISVLNMFWSNVGELENELVSMDECMPIYQSLSKGHGTGADTAMRAEAMLMRGADDEAEAICYKSMYLSQSKRQTVLYMCAELTLARIMILRGDAKGYAKVLEGIKKHADAAANRFVLRASELLRTTLSLILNKTEEACDWISDLERMSNVLYAPAIPFGHILYGRMLLLKKRYSELFGVSDMMIETAERFHYLLPQVYHLLHLALAKNSNGKTNEAKKDLARALSIALPDRVYLPFAEQGTALIPLLEAVRLSVDDRMGIDAIISLCQRLQTGAETIRKSLFYVKSPLTGREREVALLAKDRLSAKEIAETLFISENTVKSTLKAVYCKLDVHSRTELAKSEF